LNDFVHCTVLCIPGGGGGDSGGMVRYISYYKPRTIEI